MQSRYGVGVLLALAFLGCDGTAPAPDGGSALDAGRDASSGACANDEACSDGVVCNGEEDCDPADPAADEQGCVPATPIACPAGQSCDEALGGCTGECVEADGDGDSHDAISCGGDDCDDADDARFPGNAEVCDDEAHDEDCDEATLGPVDVDLDGQVSSACCNGDLCGSDCDDAAAAVFDGATEGCNAVDDDCDGAVDEGLSVGSYYPDCDGDGAGALGSTPSVGCGAPTGPPPCAVTLPGAGWSLSSGDCNDTSTAVGPGVTELCNGGDDNCNGSVDEGAATTCYQDLDGDARGNALVSISSCVCPAGYVIMAGDCNDTPGTGASIFPGATELCDGYDNNCNGVLDYPGEDDDADGFADRALCAGAPNATDCDDTRNNVFPGATETIANGRDDSCDGQELCYVNADRDAFGTSSTVATSDIACTNAMMHASVSGDCCDTDNRAYPGQTLYFTTARTGCGGYDFNCVDGEEITPLPYPATLSTGSCGMNPTCAGSTLTAGWAAGGPPTSCGATSDYYTGCSVRQICAPSCINFCRQGTETHTRSCR